MNSKYNKTAKTIKEKSEALKCPVIAVTKHDAPQAELWYVEPLRSQYKSELGTKQRSGKLTTISQIKRAAPDLAMYLGVSAIRVSQNDGCVVLEVPKDSTEIVRREFLYADKPTEIVLGKSIKGDTVTADISKRPHILVGGATGMGKSVMLHTILYGLMPIAELILIDPKQVEFQDYRKLRNSTVVTDKEKALKSLELVRLRMESRLKRMARRGVKDIEGINEHRIAVVIDELASLTLYTTDARDLLIELAEKGRVAGIHLITATQTPKANVISTNFRNNCGIRVAFSVPDYTASNVILGRTGAQFLSAPGDGLVLDGNTLTRFQAAMTDLSYLKKLKRKGLLRRIIGL